jgi:hypothetical protein
MRWFRLSKPFLPPLDTEGIFAAGQLTETAQITQTKYASGFVKRLRCFFEL